jgi:hypothetical protein
MSDETDDELDYPSGYVVFIEKTADVPAGWREVSLVEDSQPAMGWNASGETVECKMIQKV